MVIPFRKNLINALKAKGHEVVVIAFDDVCAEDISALGVTFYSVQLNNRGLNPFANLRYKKQLKAIFKKENPEIVFTFQLKPNLFATQAARAVGIKNIFSMVEGAGDVFINNSLKWKAIRFVVCRLYRKAFKYAKTVFFLNNDDKAEFIQRKLVRVEQCEVVHGIGVDLEHFSFTPIKNYRTFLMVARMLKTKGIFEYCECARIVKQKYPDAVFNYLGAEGTVTLADIQEYIDDGSICYLGTTKDVRPHIEDCILLLLLSSYREGLPMSIMEAQSMGRGVITSDNVGCRDTVVDGYNGFLIDQKDYQAMADKCIWAIENPEQAKQIGANARQFSEEHFDSVKINQRIISILENV
jgi:glycosyltransferase involved in cell wall biosynthesis